MLSRVPGLSSCNFSGFGGAPGRENQPNEEEASIRYATGPGYIVSRSAPSTRQLIRAPFAILEAAAESLQPHGDLPILLD